MRMLLALSALCASGLSPLSAVSQLANPPQPTGALVDIGGRRLHLNRAGSGSPTVILENGGGSFSLDWSLVQPEVARFTQVVAYDRAGHAWSDPGPTQDTIAQIVDDLHLLLRTVGIKPPLVLVGQSIGGIFVRAYQRRFPDEVVGLVLVDATPDDGLSFEVHGKTKALSLMTAEELETIPASPPESPPPPAQSYALRPPFDRIPKQLYAAREWASQRFLPDLDFSPRSRVTAESWREEFVALRRQRLAQPHPLGDLPLIVLRRDRHTNADAIRMHAAVAALSSAGKVVIAENSGHVIQLWRPDVVTAAIRDVVTAARKRLSATRQP
jgi:pimeloyl-ACP methyl ester carboxylesterase